MIDTHKRISSTAIYVPLWRHLESFGSSVTSTDELVVHGQGWQRAAGPKGGHDFAHSTPLATPRLLLPCYATRRGTTHSMRIGTDAQHHPDRESSRACVGYARSLHMCIVSRFYSSKRSNEALTRPRGGWRLSWAGSRLVDPPRMIWTLRLD